MALMFASAHVSAIGSRDAPGTTTLRGGQTRRQHQQQRQSGGRGQRGPVRAASVRIEFTKADGADVIVSDVGVRSVLREVALGGKVELYSGMAKMLNCGGAGQCGTCAVMVTEGMELLSERTAAEDGKLKGKPDNWRLACQCLVGGDAGGDEAPEGAVLKVTNSPKK